MRRFFYSTEEILGILKEHGFKKTANYLMVFGELSKIKEV